MNAGLKNSYMEEQSARLARHAWPTSYCHGHGGRALSWKRIFDVVLVIATTPISIPLLLLSTLLAMLDGHAPFFLQARIGYGGRVFRMLKLRTMRINAEAHLTALLMQDTKAAAEWQRSQKLRDDPRVTWAGRILRKTSLDELPQLWNVLRGDMSLVGPRPMLQTQAIMYPGTAYFRLKPGLTGPWQVFARNEDSFACRAKYDAMYELKVGVFYDLSLIIRTVGVVLGRTGH